MTTTIDAFVGSIGLVALLLFFYGPWQWVWTDIVRQMIFEKRDQLFNMALAGEISFDSMHYREVRESMEGLIRFAHEITLFRVFSLYWGFRRHDIRIKDTRTLSQAADGIKNAAVRQKVKKLRDDTYFAVIAAMIIKSPFGLALVLAIVPAFFLASLVLTMRGVYRKVSTAPVIRNVGDTIDVEAKLSPVAC